MIFDLHCDTIKKIWADRRENKQTSLRENEYNIDLLKMKKAGYGLQCFAAYVDKGEAKALKSEDIRYKDESEYPMIMANDLIEIFWNEMNKNKDIIAPVYNRKDILENEKSGRMSALLTIEGGEACLGDFALLKDYYDKGVRLMTLTWNYENELGCPNTNFGEPQSLNVKVPQCKRGLTPKGIEFVNEMQQLGMIVDVSHLSDEGFMDVALHAKKPFVASHSNARSLATHVRNLTDDMIKIIADKGGVIGINYYCEFLRDFKENEVHKSMVSDMADHISYMKKIGGIDCIGLGSDFDGIDGELEIPDCSKMSLLFDELKKRGFTSDEIDKISYMNVRNLLFELL